MTTTKWVIDPTHSEIKFKVKHLMITNVTGSFGKFNASIESSNEDYSDAKITFSANADSVNTGMEMRDTHLKGDDFFNAE
ncbi:MAG: YceI family protein, partial [Ignavibacteria bacterium]|nr:YceI family protein [Ignavibacteria bacterium]